MTRLFVRFAAATGLMAAIATYAGAEQVALDLSLAPATNSHNRLNVTVSVLGGSGSDSTPLSGNALTTLDLDYAPDGSITAMNTIAFTGGRVQLDETLDINIDLGFFVGEVDVVGTGLAGRLNTPGAAGSIQPNGDFPLSPAHQMIINEGNLDARGNGLLVSGIDFRQNMAAEPIVAPLTGTGNLSITLDSVVGNTATYSVSLTSAVDFSEVIPVDPVSVTVAATGTILAQGSYTRFIPTPGDVNGDGNVDNADFGIVAFNFGTSSGATRGQGDLDGDGDLDNADFGIVASNFGTAVLNTRTAAVPEPASAGLLALAGLLCAARRRR